MRVWERYLAERKSRLSIRRIVGWRPALAVSVLLGCVIAALGVRGDSYRPLSSTASSSATETTRSAAPEPGASARTSPQQQDKRVEVEVITIRPSGFEPREITRPKGLFVIAVENRSGLQVVQLRLDHQGGLRLRDLQMPRNKHDWKDAFDLAPGRYVLTEAYHPNWSCSITITGQ